LSWKPEKVRGAGGRPIHSNRPVCLTSGGGVTVRFGPSIVMEADGSSPFSRTV
jgi:hypothetical protein